MKDPEAVKRLAALARLTLPPERLEAFTQEFEHILAYVGQLDELSVSAKGEPHTPYVNVFREDGPAREPGTYTKAITAQFPRKEGDQLSVKPIISHD